MHQGALSGAGGTEQEEVLASGEADAHQVDDLVLADEGALHGREHGFLEALAEDGGGGLAHGWGSARRVATAVETSDG